MMKIKTKSLRDALAACAPATKLRTPLPILQCVRLEAYEGELGIRASNMDVFIERRVECEGSLEACAVPLRNIQAALSFDGGDELEITATGSGLSIAGGSRGNLVTVNVKEFPDWPTDEAKPFGVNCVDLADGIDSVVWATLDGDTRPALSNVLVMLTATAIEVIGFNGHVLAHFSRPAIAAESELNIPRGFVESLSQALREDEAVLSICDKAAIVEHKHGKTRIKLSAELFPKGWRKIMEGAKELPGLNLPVSELKNACAAAVTYGSIKMSPRLKVISQGDGNVRFLTRGDRGDVYDKPVPFLGSEKIEAKSEFNAQYLIAALQQMDTENVLWIPQGQTTNAYWQCGDCVTLINGLIAEERL